MKRLIAVAVIALSLAGCATLDSEPKVQVQTRVVDTACTWVNQITFSKNDTPDTKRQIIEHDKALMENCPNKSKKK